MATRPNYFTVTLDGELLGTFDDDELTLDDAIVFENSTKMPLQDMLNQIDLLRPLALRALVWWMKYKAGKPEDLAAINFKLKQLKIESVDFPTKAGGRSKRSGTPTSPTSPTSAT